MQAKALLPEDGDAHAGGEFEHDRLPPESEGQCERAVQALRPDQHGQQQRDGGQRPAFRQQQSGGDNGSAVGITGLQDWQVFFYRGNAWTNPLSSDAMQEQAAAQRRTGPGGVAQAAQLPDGVRIILTLSGGQAITGDLVHDWVRPTVGGGKSS